MNPGGRATMLPAVMRIPSFITYDRKVLYDEVWAEPVRDVAKRYGVSDVALAKTCRRLEVPLPGRGYWAKKAAGKAAPRPPLHPRLTVPIRTRFATYLVSSPRSVPPWLPERRSR